MDTKKYIRAEQINTEFLDWLKNDSGWETKEVFSFFEEYEGVGLCNVGIEFDSKNKTVSATMIDENVVFPATSLKGIKDFVGFSFDVDQCVNNGMECYVKEEGKPLVEAKLLSKERGAEGVYAVSIEGTFHLVDEENLRNKGKQVWKNVFFSLKLRTYAISVDNYSSKDEAEGKATKAVEEGRVRFVKSIRLDK